MSARHDTILVVDDKPNMLSLLERVLGEEHTVLRAANGREALEILARRAVDLVISDIVMPEAGGMDLLSQARRQSPGTQIILMTGYGTVEQAVAAVKAGAFDYVTKPFDPDEMAEIARRALALRRRMPATGAWPGVIGESPAIRAVFKLMESVRFSDTTVLLTGESGTGKGVIARALHAGGRRASGRFVSVNCGAIPKDLLEAELMGYEAGAFSGAVGTKKGLVEEADGGTLFLDEIGELPLELQVKLNALLQERELRRIGETASRPVRARFIAATNRDLASLVAGRAFREDLYFRLNVFPLTVPPLRERVGDVLTLARFCLEQAAAREGKPITTIAPAVVEALKGYAWPGNVRELENVIDRAVILAGGPELTAECFPGMLFGERPATASLTGDLTAMTYRELMETASEAATRAYLEQLLELYNGNVTRAAVHAGIERQSLHRLLKRHGLRSAEYKP